MKSKFFTLSWHDFFKGSIVAVLTGIFTFAAVKFDVQPTVATAIISSLASYLIKNLFTNNRDQLLTSDKP
jgi:hypothetical protein